MRPGIMCALALCFWAAVTGPAGATVVYVNWNTGSSGSWDGKTWATAYPTLQMGIDSARNNVSSNREVWVANPLPAAAAYVQPITLYSGIAVYGGFAGTETARSQRNPKANPTILEAPGANVVTASARGFALDGFTIRNGAQGIVLTSASGIISNCVVSGIPNIGLVTNGGFAEVSDCVFRDNGTGIMVLAGGAVRVSNCTVTGGAIGIYEMETGWMTVANCIVANNQTGLKTDLNAEQPTVTCTNVYGNKDYGMVNRTGKDGNISQDPLFTNAAAGDFHLLPGSPCIDSGDDSFVFIGARDVDGRPRVAGAHVDMGAHEYNPAYLTRSDVTAALRIAGGLAVSDSVAMGRLNVDPGSARIELRDALRLARKVAGLEPNP